MAKIDREKLNKLLDKKEYDLNDLFDIILFLRCEDGCPWDKVQTHESIKINLIEESYELLDAIDKKDDEKLKEEIGDVLLQAVFHSVMAKERNAFTMEEVISAICQKLIFRHSHIFGEDVARNETEALSTWDKNKVKEKGFLTGASYVSDVPKNFPALLRAEKVQKRAGKYGLDFVDTNQIYEKINEELIEVKKAEKENDKSALKEEVGDLLFSVVNLARFLGVEAEEALSESTVKFTSRFSRAEALAEKDGKGLKSLSEKEWDEYYNASKKD